MKLTTFTSAKFFYCSNEFICVFSVHCRYRQSLIECRYRYFSATADDNGDGNGNEDVTLLLTVMPNLSGLG